MNITVIANETVTVVFCSNSSNVTQPLTDISSAVQILPVSGDPTAKLILAGTLDFEATKEYDIFLEIADTTNLLLGNITIRVRKSPAVGCSKGGEHDILYLKFKSLNLKTD